MGCVVAGKHDRLELTILAREPWGGHVGRGGLVTETLLTKATEQNEVECRATVHPEKHSHHQTVKIWFLH